MPADRLHPPLPTLNWVRALLAPALVLIATSLDRGYQTDFWHHLARGRATVERGAILDTDVFTFTVHGQPLRDANWLTQVLYYRLFQAGGLPLVQLVNSLALAAAVGLLVFLCWRVSRSPKLSAAAGVGAFLALWQTFLIRPQTFSLLLFVTLYLVLTEAARRRWLLVLPPLLMALWANLHGGFPIGLVLIGAFFAGSAWEWWTPGQCRSLTLTLSRRERGQEAAALGACLAASAAATLLNPYGYTVYAYALTLSSTAAGRGIEEWLPPGLGTWTGRAFAASLVLVVGLLGAARRRATARQVWLLACFLPLACGSVRMVAWWVLVAAPVAVSLGAGLVIRGRRLRLRATHCPPTGAKPQAAPRPTWAAGLTVVLLLATVVLSLPWFERYNPLFRGVRSGHRTESDLQVIADHLRLPGAPARVYTRLEWGEYLSWAASPEVAVFMDGRIEIYPDDVWAQYTAVTAGYAQWQPILDGYGVDGLLLDATYHGGLLPQVRRSPAWREAMSAGPAVLFVRAGAPAVTSRDREGAVFVESAGTAP